MECAPHVTMFDMHDDKKDFQVCIYSLTHCGVKDERDARVWPDPSWIADHGILWKSSICTIDRRKALR